MLNKIKNKFIDFLRGVVLFLGHCPDCGEKLFTWSYGKQKCDNCLITYYS